MGTIKVHEFTTLDGVVGAPMWTTDYPFTDEMAASIGALTDGGSEAILLGRTTWQEMGPAWSSRSTEDDPGTSFFNGTPKHVVSGTLDSAEGWANSTILGAYDPARIQELKDGVAGGMAGARHRPAAARGGRLEFAIGHAVLRPAVPLAGWAGRGQCSTGAQRSARPGRRRPPIAWVTADSGDTASYTASMRRPWRVVRPDGRAHAAAG